MNRLTDEQRELAGRYAESSQKWGDRLANQYPKLAEEMRTAVVMALMESASTWEPNRNVKFSTYLFKLTKYRTLDVLEKYFAVFVKSGISRKDAEPHLFHGDLNYDSDLTNQWGMYIGNNSVLDELKEKMASTPIASDTEIFEKMIATLPPSDRRMIRDYCEEGLNQAQIADRLGLSKSRISVKLGDAIQRLRENLADRQLVA